jgi:hypothetical protein
VGVGIHPEESSICSNAYIDRSIPLEGGMLALGISKGLDTYEGGELMDI